VLYIRTFAGGKEKWTGFKTTLLSVAKNWTKERVDAAERQKNSRETVTALGKLASGAVMEIYRRLLHGSGV
jgi:hypothetical protein